MALVRYVYKTAAAFTAENPTLYVGTIGIESDTGKYKLGDNATAWNSLAYAAAVPSDVVGLMDLKGSTDCSSNPNYPAASKGDAYAVSVAGKIGGASGTSVEVGDVYFAIADNAGGTQAAVGSSWIVQQGNVAFTSAGIAMATAADAAAQRALITKQSFVIACSDETTALTTGAAKVTFRMPYAFTMSAAPSASLSTAQTSGSIFTVNIKKNGSTIFSTKITIDNTEKTTATAATAAVLSSTTFAADDEVTIDIDQVGDGTAKGLKVAIVGYPT